MLTANDLLWSLSRLSRSCVCLPMREKFIKNNLFVEQNPLSITCTPHSSVDDLIVSKILSGVHVYLQIPCGRSDMIACYSWLHTTVLHVAMLTSISTSPFCWLLFEMIDLPDRQVKRILKCCPSATRVRLCISKCKRGTTIAMMCMLAPHSPAVAVPQHVRVNKCRS